MEILDAIIETYNATIPIASVTTGKSFIVNAIKYALPILVYERLPYKYYTWPFAYIIFIYMSIEPILDTSLLNIIASKKSLQIKGCDCSENQIIRGNISSPIYYLGHMAFINLLYFIPFIGFPIFWVLYPTIYGFGIMEFFLAGMCTKHKYKYFSEIMPFCFGVGACIHGLAIILSYLVLVDNPFFYTAILNILNTQVIMNARFCPKVLRKLPNPFHLSRASTSYLIKVSSEKILEKLERQEIEIPILLKYFNKVKFLFGPEFQNLKSFLGRDVCKYLLMEHEPKIKRTLDTVIEVSRQTNAMWFIEMLGDIVPDYIISEKTRIVLKILQKEGMTDKLIYVRNIFEDVCYESTATIFSDVDIIEDHFRSMSRSPSIEFMEDDDFMVLKYPKDHS